MFDGESSKRRSDRPPFVRAGHVQQRFQHFSAGRLCLFARVQVSVREMTLADPSTEVKGNLFTLPSAPRPVVNVQLLSRAFVGPCWTSAPRRAPSLLVGLHESRDPLRHTCIYRLSPSLSLLSIVIPYPLPSFRIPLPRPAAARHWPVFLCLPSSRGGMTSPPNRGGMTSIPPHKARSIPPHKGLRIHPVWWRVWPVA